MLQERHRIMDVLPAVIPPGAQPFCFEPAPHHARRDVWQTQILSHAPCQLCSAPARERHLALFGQTTSDSRDLRTDLREENALVLLNGVRW